MQRGLPTCVMPVYTEDSFQRILQVIIRATRRTPVVTRHAMNHYFTYYFLDDPNSRNDARVHLTVSFFSPTGFIRIGCSVPTGVFRRLCRLLRARDAPLAEWDQFRVNTAFGWFIFQYERRGGNRTSFWMWSIDNSESRGVIKLTKRLFLMLKAIQYVHAGGAASVTAEEER